MTIPVPKTIADGAMTAFLGARSFPIIKQHVRDIVTIPDEALAASMRFFAERMKLIVEPTGCLAAAAAFAAADEIAGMRVGGDHLRRERGSGPVFRADRSALSAPARGSIGFARVSRSGCQEFLVANALTSGGRAVIQPPLRDASRASRAPTG